MKVVGYGICGPGEASRYMRETMEDFKRLCDVTVILCNNVGPQEKAMIYEYGFRMVQDNREWGKLQWKIKQDFLQTEVSRFADDGDMVVCLDMDETLDRRLTKQWLIEAPLDAYQVFIVDLWNDPEHYKPKSCFWNCRIFRWNGIIDFTKKPVHCGLAPEWARAYNRYAPFLLLHKGLMLKKDRERKIARYEKYDPNMIHLGRPYYAMLTEDSAELLDERSLHDTIAKEVESYKQSRPRGPSIYMNKKNERFAYFRNPAGFTVDVPERHVELTKKQPGMTFVGWADDAAAEIEDLLAEDDEIIEDGDEEIDSSLDVTALSDDELEKAIADTEGEEEGATPGDPVEEEGAEPAPAPRGRVGVEAQARPVKRPNAPATKKAAKKAPTKAVKKTISKTK